MSNKDLWQRVFTTDPRAVKPITGKQYNGNSPKPYWIVERLTDEFGPCGIGWGFTILNERMERLTETDVLHVAVVRFWYVLGDKRGEFEQIGQTKAVYEKSKGGFMVDEDAPKKSVTDALVKCASYLGFAGDIFSGMWDDSKYVQQAGAEWDRRTAGDSQGASTKAAGKKEPAERTVLMKVVHAIQDHLANGRELGALQEYDLAWERGEDFVSSVWNSLTTPQREEITRIQNANQKAHA